MGRKGQKNELTPKQLAIKVNKLERKLQDTDQILNDFTIRLCNLKRDYDNFKKIYD